LVFWNRRLFFQGGGGTDGTVNPALGTLGNFASSNALVSTDAGHVSEPMPPFIGDALFGLEPQARVDYGYRAVGRTSRSSKPIA
jgi:feruloyl esterase